MTKFIIAEIILTILLSISIVVVGYNIFFINPIHSTENVMVEEPTLLPNSPLSNLYTNTKGNPIILGDELLKKGRYSSARSFYENALKTATTPAEEAHINYKIALSYVNEDIRKDISLMKAIIDNKNYPDMQKAYAVQHLGLILNGVYGVDKSVEDFIYIDEPYKSFLLKSDNNTYLAFVEVNKYALSFGDVPVSHLFVGSWYAKALLDNKDNATVYNSYLQQAESHLQQSMLYEEENKNVYNNKSLIPFIKTYQAHLIGLLAEAGIDKYRNQYVSAFQEAITVSTLTGTDGSNRSKFAQTVAKLNDESARAEAEIALKPLLDDIDKYPGMKAFYEQSADGTWGERNKNDLIDIANFFSEFKKLLLTLGWKTEYFK